MNLLKKYLMALIFIYYIILIYIISRIIYSIFSNQTDNLFFYYFCILYYFISIYIFSK